MLVVVSCCSNLFIISYSTAQMQRRSRSHYFASGEYTRVIFDVQVTLCYSRALEMTNSRVIFPRDNRSSTRKGTSLDPLVSLRDTTHSRVASPRDTPTQEFFHWST